MNQHLTNAPPPLHSLLDPFTDANLESPYELQRHLIEAGPIVWLERYSAYATGRMAVIEEVLGNTKLFTSRRGVGLLDERTRITSASGDPSPLTRDRNPLIEADPPGHTLIRQLLEDIMTPALIQHVAERTSVFSRQLLAQPAEEKIDLFSELLVPVVLKIWPDAVGIRDDGREALVALGELTLNSLGPKNHVLHRSMPHFVELGTWLNDALHPANLAPYGIGQQVIGKCRQAGLPPAASSDLLKTILIAAIDTTLAAAANTLFVGSQNPEAWEPLHKEPETVGKFVDEALRLEAPIQVCYRAIERDAVVQGVRVKAGRRILLHLGASARDRAIFDEAHLCRPHRRPRKHLAFGAGVHHCIGRAVAIRQVTAIIQEVARQFAMLDTVEPPRFKLNNTLRSASSVVVRAPRRGAKVETGGATRVAVSRA